MKVLWIFIKKELVEQLRTYKTMILTAILFLFGMTSPVLAKMMPEILKNADVGFDIVLPTPTYIDAYTQFFKNISQMGILVIILVFSGIVSQEKVKGTMLLMLTKNLSRTQYILGKYLGMLILFTTTYAISCASFVLYTKLLFPDADFSHFMFSLFCLWLFIVLLLTVTLLASTLVANPYIGTITAFSGWFILLMSIYVPGFSKLTPSNLGTQSMSIVMGITTLEDMIMPIGIGTGLILILLFVTIGLIKKQELVAG